MRTVPTAGRHRRFAHFAFDRRENFTLTGLQSIRPALSRRAQRRIYTRHIHYEWGIALASDERGTKRTCPVTGKKFYDLGKDPVVSPYTGKSYPLSFFEAPQEKAASKFGAKERKKAEADEPEDTVEEADVDTAAAAAGAEVISLDDAEKSTSGNDNDDDDDDEEEIPDVEDVEVDDELGGDDDDSFLESDDDEDDIDFDVEVDEDER